MSSGIRAEDRAKSACTGVVILGTSLASRGTGVADQARMLTWKPVLSAFSFGGLVGSMILTQLFACTADATPLGGRASRSGEDEGEPSAANYTRDGSVYDSAPNTTSELGLLRFMPSIASSGFDGTHTFKVPIAVYDADPADLEVTMDDPSAAKIVKTALEHPISANGTADTGAYFMVTVLKAQPIVLTATSRGRTTTAKINVTTYEPSRWSIGETRYKNGNASASNPACTRCHVGGKAIDHSPAALATARDGEVGYIITNGIKPGPVPITGVDCADCSETGKKHQWTVSDEERDGLITYLRSLEPRGFK